MEYRLFRDDGGRSRSCPRASQRAKAGPDASVMGVGERRKVGELALRHKHSNASTPHAKLKKRVALLSAYSEKKSYVQRKIGEVWGDSRNGKPPDSPQRHGGHGGLMTPEVGERKPGCRVPHSRPSFGLEWGAIRRDDPAPPHIRGFRMCGKRRSGPSLIRAEPVSGPGFSRRGQFIANGGDPTGRGSRERAHPACSAQPPQRAQPRCSLGTPVRRCTLG